jgi:hypothetical protein
LQYQRIGDDIIGGRPVSNVAQVGDECEIVIEHFSIGSL